MTRDYDNRSPSGIFGGDFYLPLLPAARLQRHTHSLIKVRHSPLKYCDYYTALILSFSLASWLIPPITEIVFGSAVSVNIIICMYVCNHCNRPLSPLLQSPLVAPYM